MKAVYLNQTAKLWENKVCLNIDILFDFVDMFSKLLSFSLPCYLYTLFPSRLCYEILKYWTFCFQSKV